MAVTADYDPSRWPDLAHAMATDLAPVLALERAVEERWAVVRSVGASERSYTNLPLLNAPGGPTKQSVTADACAPLLDRLVAVRAEIEALAPYFIDLDESEMHYAYDRFATFPRSFYRIFQDSEPVDAAPGSLRFGPHALVALPEALVTDWSDASLEAYRQWLCNAAWWLDRFRYTCPFENSFLLRRFYGDEVERTATGATNDPAGTDVVDALDGTPSKVEQRAGTWYNGWVDGRRVQYHMSPLVCAAINHALSVDYRAFGPRYDRAERAEVLRLFSLFRVNNAAPLAATGRVYLAASARPARTKSRKWTDNIDDDANTCDYHEDSTTEQWYNGWKETRRLRVDITGARMNPRQRPSVAVETTRTYRKDGSLASETVATTDYNENRSPPWKTTERTKTFQEDGSLASDTTETFEAGGLATIDVPYSRDDFSIEATDAPVDDEDYPSVGEAIQIGPIAAFSHSEPIPERSVAPRPAVWDLDPLNEAQWGRVRFGSFSAALATNFRLVPILDYYESFKNGADEWRSSA